jgi:hypothetical protein
MRSKAANSHVGPMGRRGPLGAATVILAGLAAALLVSAPAAAQENHQDLGAFQDWQAYTYTQGGGKRCTQASQPTRDEGDYSRRGPIWAFVMHRPDEGATGEVGFHMGYPIRDGSTVEVTIGGRSFQLYTSGEGAFAWPEDEPGLIAAMRAGASMVVEGVSARGTETRDTYSLSGFTAANRAINEACGAG